MGDSADKAAALADAARALDGIGASHALVGGVAVGLRSGVARATMDTDLAVRSLVARATVVEAMVRAGFGLRGEFAHSVNFRHASDEPVRLVFDPEFDAMIDRAEALDVGGLIMRVVTTRDLIVMKERAAPRSRPPAEQGAARPSRRGVLARRRSRSRRGVVGRGPVRPRLNGMRLRREVDQALLGAPSVDRRRRQSGR